MSLPHDDSGALTRALVDLENKTGYRIMQTNGQRKCGPPPGWLGPPPNKGSEVFIGKVPRNCYENELFPLFARIGKIYELRLMMDFSGSNRGYAFVMYTNAEDARSACRELNNYEIRRGRRIGVVQSRDNCRLFVGKIPRDKTKQDIFDAMSMITDGVVDAIVHTCYDDPSKNRGYAFVEYEDHRAAAMARRKLLPGKTPLWNNVEVQVDWAQPENDLDDAVMENVSNLYVRNLAPNVTEIDIAQLFLRNLPFTVSITKVKKIKDFAFVHFKDRSLAERVLQFTRQNQMFGIELSADGNFLNIMWAKPANARGRRNLSDRWSDEDQVSPQRQASGVRLPAPEQNHRQIWSNNGYYTNDPQPDPYQSCGQQFSWPIMNSPVPQFGGFNTQIPSGIPNTFDIWQPTRGDVPSALPAPSAHFSPLPSHVGQHGRNVATPIFRGQHSMDLMTGTPFNALRSSPAIVG